MSLIGTQGSTRSTVSKTLVAMAIATFAGTSALAPTSTLAAPGDALGPPFQVDLPTYQPNYGPSIARSASGAFVVVWGTGRKIMGRRFSSNAQPLDDGFVIDEVSGPFFEEGADVAMDERGDFVVAWNVRDNLATGSPDRAAAHIYARRYSADGTPAGTRFSVDGESITTRDESPVVAMNRAGRFVVSWLRVGYRFRTRGTYTYYQPNTKRLIARTFTTDGLVVGQEQVLAPAATVAKIDDGYDIGSDHDVAIDADGDFVAAWTRTSALYLPLVPFCNNYGCGLGTFGTRSTRLMTRRYTADGKPSQSPVLATSEPSLNGSGGDIASPSIAMADDGDFVLGWSQGSFRTASDIQTRRFKSNGLPKDRVVTVGTVPIGGPPRVRVAASTRGGFVAAWETSRSSFDIGISVRRYDGNSAPVAAATDIRFNLPGFDLASDPLGNFVLAWSQLVPGHNGQYDYTSNAIFGQAFEGP